MRGRAALRDRRHDAGVDAVVLEVKGGRKRSLVCQPLSAGLTAARVNLRQVHDRADLPARHKDRGKYLTPVLGEPRQSRPN